MLQKKEDLFSFDNAEVIAERNKLIAERVGKMLEYGNGKIQDLCRKLNSVSEDPSPRALLEFLYERMWSSKPGINRDVVQNIIATCHGEAFDGLQYARPDLWDD